MFLTTLIYLAFAANAQTLPAGEGKDIVQQQCGGCHAMKVVTSKRASKEQWSTLVNQMVTRGAEIEDDDIQTVIDYLAKNFGPDAPPAADAGKNPTGSIHVNAATAAELASALQLSDKQSSSIVSYREKNGNFKDWRDLTKVPGIEFKKIESNKDRLVF
ncbi:MAG: helix-hairpin-helix domain-containing protein [Terriglobales bacterium]